MHNIFKLVATSGGTYLLGIVLMLMGLCEFIGLDVPGITNADATATFMSGLGIVTGRASARKDAERANDGTLPHSKP